MTIGSCGTLPQIARVASVAWTEDRLGEEVTGLRVVGGREPGHTAGPWVAAGMWECPSEAKRSLKRTARPPTGNHYAISRWSGGLTGGRGGGEGNGVRNRYKTRYFTVKLIVRHVGRKNNQLPARECRECPRGGGEWCPWCSGTRPVRWRDQDDGGGVGGGVGVPRGVPGGHMVARKAPGYRGNPRGNTPGLPGDSRRISGIMVPFGLSWSLWH